MTDIETALRKLRGRLAYSKQCEPYKIFRDVELNLLLSEKPRTIENLSKIKGFPKTGKRVQNYGQAIIDCFNRPESIEDFDVKLDASGEPVANTVLKKMNLF